MRLSMVAWMESNGHTTTMLTIILLLYVTCNLVIKCIMFELCALAIICLPKLGNQVADHHNATSLCSEALQLDFFLGTPSYSICSHISLKNVILTSIIVFKSLRHTSYYINHITHAASCLLLCILEWYLIMIHFFLRSTTIFWRSWERLLECS